MRYPSLLPLQQARPFLLWVSDKADELWSDEAFANLHVQDLIFGKFVTGMMDCNISLMITY